ncbi:transcriptional regulator [Pseudomonas syringae]|jgi:DNA-binding phage protein|uniref:transcriptional regulator n=1 Tax=Pseudomonas syringae TaxID=317 RepID=UPI000BB5BE58|nr:transcriptional regulator [Pseudomonas syringae]PBP67736.1 transcriptional regulator [Pseudomonas syringae]
MKSRTHDEFMAEQINADPHYAAELLSEVRRNGDAAEVAILLRQMSTAFRQVEGWSLSDTDRTQLP